MENKCYPDGHPPGRYLTERCKSIPKRALPPFRLTTLFLSVFMLSLSADAYGQYVDLHLKNSDLNTFVKEIRKQTGYSFVYNAELKKTIRSISVDIENGALKSALDRAFADQSADYLIEGKLITLLPKKPAIPQSGFSETPADDRQQSVLSGRVLDSLGNPMPNATVRVKDAEAITVTDGNGFFRLENAGEEAILQISFLGYQTVEIAASANLEHIVLQPLREELEEIVVHTGFQTLNKERATGAFASIDRDQLERPATNIAQRIIGTSAGVQATLDVDGNPRFEIRGQTALNIRSDGELTANAYPLVVVDGFAVQGDFGSINPNDVESITILKDAAAASIWGARAANGVIVIVTKKARSGVPLKVDFQAFTRLGSRVDLAYVNPLAGSFETIAYEKRAFNRWSAITNSGSLTSDYRNQWSQGLVAMSEHDLGFLSEADRDAELARLQTLDNRQQIRDLLLAAPMNQQYNLTFREGSARMNNLLSLLHARNQSNFRETANERSMLNYRTTAKLFPWLDFHGSVMLQYNDHHRNGVSLGDIQGLSPYDMLVGPDGSYTNIHRYYWPIMERFVPMDQFPYADWTYNPAREIHARDFSSKELNTRLMGGLTVRPLPGLSFDTKIQYELFNTFNRNLYDEDSFFVRRRVNEATAWNRTTNVLTPNLPKGSILDRGRAKVSSYIFRNQINYNRSFAGTHEINAIAGSEVSNFVTEEFVSPTAYGYNDETLTVGTFPNGPGGAFAPIRDWMGSSQTFRYINQFTYRTERFLSLYANAAYTYLGRYTLSGSVRTDASNMITDDPAYRYAPFWSVGGAYQLGREAFMSELTGLDRLNLRLTYGYNGNVDRSTSFRPLISLNTRPNDYTGDYTASISSYGNPTLRWERTGTWNLGLDYSLWQGKLYGKVDLYDKQGEDLIAELSIPAVNGTGKQKLNNAAISNRGIEVEFGTTLPIHGSDIVWKGNLNFSYNKNRVTKLFVANYTATQLYGWNREYGDYVEGYDANTMWMFEYAGIKNSQPTVKGANGDTYEFGGWAPGDGRDYLLNMGTRVAPYTLGFSNSFKLYDFNLSFILTGKMGHVFRTMPFNYPDVGRGKLLPNSKLADIQNADPERMVPLPLNDNEPMYYFWDRFYPYMSYLSANASHLRMQEISATYRLPTQKWALVGKSEAMVYVQGNDLFTVLFNDAGEDPEYRMGRMKPRPKVTFGLKVGF